MITQMFYEVHSTQPRRVSSAVACTIRTNLDNEVRVANMGPTWVLAVPGWPHVGPMNFVNREGNNYAKTHIPYIHTRNPARAINW